MGVLRKITYVAVALKISFVLAEVMVLKMKEKTAVKPATAPIRPGILWIVYSTAMPAMGRSEATRVDKVFKRRKVSLSR